MDISLTTPLYYDILFSFCLVLIIWTHNLKLNSSFHLNTVMKWNYFMQQSVELRSCGTQSKQQLLNENYTVGGLKHGLSQIN